MLGHAQESVGSLVEAAEDMAQEVRGQCSLRPCQETRGVGCRKGRGQSNPGHLSSVVVWGYWGRKRGQGCSWWRETGKQRTEMAARPQETLGADVCG